MPDQATELRRRVQSERRIDVSSQGPRTLVVAGGRPGVGATTLALHISNALAQEASRIVLIDADLYRADLAAQCNLVPTAGIGDVLAGRTTIHEALLRGPSGMNLLAGTATAETRAALSERSIQRLLRQMRALEPHADWLIIDAGSQPSDFSACLWSIADRLLLATTTDAVSVMDSYATIKTSLAGHAPRCPLLLVVNQAPDDATASDVHRRIDQSCRRFLDLSIDFAGGVPFDAQAVVTMGMRAGVAAAPPSPLAAVIARIARALTTKDNGAGSPRIAA